MPKYSRRSLWTEDQDAEIQRLDALGMKHADIAGAIGNKNRRQVCNRLYILRNPEAYQRRNEARKRDYDAAQYLKELATGWPETTPSKPWPLNCFANENVTVKPTLIKQLQPPLNHTAGGVGFGYD
jgi:hypothetical protein